MAEVNRKVTYRLYPTGQQKTVLLDTLRLHQRLYNAALEQRITAYRTRKISLSYVDQAKELTQLRAEFPEYKALNAQSEQVTLTRLDWAFQNFFRRVKSGAEKAGFPRFKSLDRYPGWGYKTHGDGWKFDFGQQLKHGKLSLSGLGFLKVRGKARNLGIPKTLEIQFKQGNWYASITLATTPQRVSGTKAIGIDWGLETFATVSDSDNSISTIANPRTLRKKLKVLKIKQRSLSDKKLGSNNRKRARQQVAKLYLKVANQRKDFLHQITNKLVRDSALIAIEQLNIKNMTASGGAYKKGLNREILSAAPSGFHQMLRYKAEEAGTQWIEIPTKRVKPSQTCHGCGRQEKKLLSVRSHVCFCGTVCGRDENAAKVILNWALYGNATGHELAWCGAETLVSAVKHETPPIVA